MRRHLKCILALLTISFFIQNTSGQKTPLLKISQDSYHIVTQSGEPFFWLGGTAWEMIHRLNREEVDLYLRDRADKGFTVIQTVVLAELDGLNTPNAYGHKPLIDNDPTRINENYFEHVDYVIKKAEKLGLYIGLLPTWGDKFNIKWGKGPVIFTPENAQKYGEILAKRYVNQNNIIWILGGDRIPENEEQKEIIRSMARGIRTVDKIHLITYHPVGAQIASEVLNEAWLDIDMFQSGHARDAREYSYVHKSKMREPKKPVINGEARYENIPDKFWEAGEHEWMDDSDVRVSAYWSMLAGAAGYTYGCNDIWQMYSINRSPVISARTDWQESLHLPGSGQMKYLKELFIAFPWQSMKNDQSLILNENIENEEYRVCDIGEAGDFIIAYTPWGRPITLDLSKMDAEKVEAYWYNPRSGKSVKINDYNTTEKVEFIPWSVGRGSDFVLIVIDINSKLKVPGLEY